MQYTVWSRGELIGETELDFAGLGANLCRSGHFHPNERGDELMAVLASESLCMRAFMHRDYRDANGNGVVSAEYIGSRWFGDIAEYLHHVAPYDLQIRHEQTGIVGVTEIGIQDNESFLHELPIDDSDYFPFDDDADADGARDAERDSTYASEHDLVFALDEFDEREGTECDTVPWDITGHVGRGYLEPQSDNELGTGWNGAVRDIPVFPRYQIHVILEAQ